MIVQTGPGFLNGEGQLSLESPEGKRDLWPDLRASWRAGSVSSVWGKAECAGKGQPGQVLPEHSPVLSLARFFLAFDGPREGKVRRGPPRGRALRLGEVPGVQAEGEGIP